METLTIIYIKKIPAYAFFNGETIHFEKYFWMNKNIYGHVAKTKDGFIIDHAPYNSITTTIDGDVIRWIEHECTFGQDDSIEVSYNRIN